MCAGALAGFALTYSRSNYREFLSRWRVTLGLFALFPLAVAITLVVRQGADAETNLWRLRRTGNHHAERDPSGQPGIDPDQSGADVRSAIGTMRWQIKFVVIGVAITFAARLYVRSQAILFSAPDIAFWSVESSALLIGCAFLAVAYARTRLAESDVYPSLAVLRSSFTVIIVGVYLFVVGVAAQLVSRFGGAEIFQFQAVVVILGMAGLACFFCRIALVSGFTRSSSGISVRHSTIRFASGRCFEAARCGQ